MADFSCDIDITSLALCESVVVTCFQKSDVIRLMSFSSKNLLEVTIKTLVLIYLEYFSYRCLKYLLFECSLKKGNILNSPFLQVRALFFSSLVPLMHSTLHVAQKNKYTKWLLQKVKSPFR